MNFNLNSPENVSTKRTAVNSGIVVFVIGLISWLTGKEIKLDSESMIYVSVIFGVVSGIFYRASRLVADNVPWLGWILFGSVMKPVAYVSTKGEQAIRPALIEPGEGIIEDPNDPGPIDPNVEPPVAPPRDHGKIKTLDAAAFAVLALILVTVAAFI